MALTFNEGSIGGDIESMASATGGLYGKNLQALNRAEREPEEPRGSNGIAIAPSEYAGTSRPAASFGARAYPGTKKCYGTSGNSFVAVVEFGNQIRARAVTADGESGHPGSAHFNDEAKKQHRGFEGSLFLPCPNPGAY